MKVGLLYYDGSKHNDRVDQVVAQHARDLADTGHEVRVVTGMEVALDPRVNRVLLPEVGLDHLEVQRVQQELAAGDVSPHFHALGLRLKAALAAALRDRDVLVAYDLCTAHRHLALSAALYDFLCERSGRAVRSRPPAVLTLCFDVAWANPGYQHALHYRYPWDLLLEPWPHVHYLAPSSEQREKLAGIYGRREQAAIIVPQPSPVPVAEPSLRPIGLAPEKGQARTVIQAWLGHWMRGLKMNDARTGRAREGAIVATLAPLLALPGWARKAEERGCA